MTGSQRFDTVSDDDSQFRFRGVLDELTCLDSTRLPLEKMAVAVARLAVRAVPTADGALVILLNVDGEVDSIATAAASHVFVEEINRIEHQVVLQGPGRTAAREGRVVRSGSLGGDRAWPRFGPRVGRLGLHSVLAVPLLLPTRTVGAIEFYSFAKHDFDGQIVELTEHFAPRAAVALHLSQHLHNARTRIEQLEAAMPSRLVIGQAIGVLRGRTGDTEAEAFARLRAISQKEHTRLTTVAQRVLDEAVGRARARQSRSRKSTFMSD